MASHDDEYSGVRLQGEKTLLRFIDPTVSFGLSLKNVDPDHAALTACLLFLPFIGHKAEFQHPVSDAISTFLADPEHSGFRRKPPIRVASATTGPRPEKD